MGRVLFAGGVRLDLEDRALAHLHRVMLMKLHKGESFHLSWRDDVSIGDGRTTIWVTPETPFVCRLGAPIDDFDPHWLERLAVAANSVQGLSPLPEMESTERPQ